MILNEEDWGRLIESMQEAEQNPMPREEYDRAIAVYNSIKRPS